ncbi:uncharacterized protein LOC132931730 [Rhopalosiphum padi]|uniref:uncharacterized protein LOC132931730 n=1 Tax=Rhopalosiphum padi TaxID=40932 RepID=UPI00298EAD8B|nr:uncharacterized protein LOC132931730 [Rhopalosiphum padi]
MDRGQQEIQKETTGPNSSVQQNTFVYQQKNLDDFDKQCLPSNSNGLNQEKEYSQSDRKTSHVKCSIGKVHQILKDKHLMYPILSNLLTDIRDYFDLTVAHYDEADILIDAVGIDTYIALFIENLVNTSSLSKLQSEPIIWEAYMMGKENNARNVTKTPTKEPQSVVANDLPSTSKKLSLVNIEDIDMHKRIKKHFQQYQLLKKNERRVIKATKYGIRVLDLDNNN